MQRSMNPLNTDAEMASIMPTVKLRTLPFSGASSLLKGSTMMRTPNNPEIDEMTSHLLIFSFKKMRVTIAVEMGEVMIIVVARLSGKT